MPNGRYVPCRNPFSERGPDPPHRRSAASATAKDKTVPSSCSEEDTPDLRSKYGTCRNPTTGRMPRRTRLTARRTPLLDIMHFDVAPVPRNFVAAATAPQRSRYRRAFASANATPDTLPLSRSEPKPARRARAPTIPYMTLHAKPTSVLPTSIAVSTAVQYGQPLTGNYSIEITTAKAALAERLLTILVSAA